MDMSKISSPWIKDPIYINDYFRLGIKSNIKYIGQLHYGKDETGLDSWEGFAIGRLGEIIRLKFTHILEDAMVATDKVLVDEGYTLLTQEQYERLQVLI
jgi:hypothetical protein